MHSDLDDVHLEDVIYWCEPAYVGRRRPRVCSWESAPSPPQVVGDYVEKERLHVDLLVVSCEGPARFDAGRRITRTLDALLATGAFRA